MRGNRERKIQLIALVFLLTIFLLFADLLIFGIFVSRNGMPYYPDSEEIMEHLHKEKGEYRLAEEESKSCPWHSNLPCSLTMEEISYGVSSCRKSFGKAIPYRM